MNAQIFTKSLIGATLLFASATIAHAFTFEIPDELKDEAAAKEAEEKAAVEAQLSQVAKEADEAESGVEAEPVVEAEAAEKEAPSFVMEAPEEETAVEEVSEAGAGRIAGQIFDKETGQPVRGVAIIVEGTDIGTITDSQGRYRMNNVPTGEYSLSFIKTGYIEATVTETIVVEGETFKLDFAMPPRPAEMSDEVYVLQDFTVTAEEAISQNVALLALRQTSVASLDALSSEDFAKFAASDAAEAISKISGASLSDGKYVVFRGLNDRYNTTLINGVRLPSPDPDRKAVALDIFPTSLFDSIIARKTYTSDMPGESSGGSVELNTKGAPEEPFIKFSFGLGGQHTSEDTDFLLTDPELIDYQDWLKGDTRVGFELVDGSEEFTDEYSLFSVGDVSFPAMAPFESSFKGFGDRSYSFSMGNSWSLTDNLTLGAIVGAKTGEKKRSSFKEVYKIEFGEGAPVLEERAIKENGGGVMKSEHEYSSSALIGLGLQIGDHSALDYTFIRAETFSSVAEVARYETFGETLLFGGESTPAGYNDYLDIELAVTERLLQAHQFSGSHIFEPVRSVETEVSWYYTDAFMSQVEPDQRVTAEYLPDFGSFSADPGLPPVTRFQRETEQDSEMYGWDIRSEVQIGDRATLGFEFGVDREKSERHFEQLEMIMIAGQSQYVTDPLFSAMPFPDAAIFGNLGLLPIDYTEGTVYFSDFEGLDDVIQRGYQAAVGERSAQFSFTIDGDPQDDIIDGSDLGVISETQALQDGLSLFSSDFIEDASALSELDFDTRIQPLIDDLDLRQNTLAAKYPGITIAPNDALKAIQDYSLSLRGYLEAQDTLTAKQGVFDDIVSNGRGFFPNFVTAFGEAPPLDGAGNIDSVAAFDRALVLASNGVNDGTPFSDADQLDILTDGYQPAYTDFQTAQSDFDAFSDDNEPEGGALVSSQSDFVALSSELPQITQQLQDYLNELAEFQALLGAPAAEFGPGAVSSFGYFDDDFYVFRTPRGFSLYGDESVQSVQFDQVNGYFQARGEEEVKSFYINGDLKVDDIMWMNSVRLAGGIRDESTSLSYRLLENDPGEPDPGSVVAGAASPVVVRPSSIDQEDRLSYLALILEPIDNLKIHLSRSTTIAKPTFREIAPFPVFNLADRSFEMGNPGLVLRNPAFEDDFNNLTGDFAGGIDTPLARERFILPSDFAGLEIAEVKSEDIRVEYFTPNDGMISIGYFWKEVEAPIERVLAYSPNGVDLNTFINNDNDASVEGIEFEIQQNLGFIEDRFKFLNLPLSWITVGGNYTKIDAEVTRSAFETAALTNDRFAGQLSGDGNQFQKDGPFGTRSLYNQPAFVANAFISLDVEKTGSKLTLSKSWTGEQLDRAGTISTQTGFPGSPDLFWDEFSSMNLVFEQELTENWKLKISVKNIDSPVREMFADDVFFTALQDDTIRTEAGGGPVNSTSHPSWRSRQTLDPTYSISVSGSW